ncbi:hypothetical protein [Hydrogenimonas sp.]
MNLFVVETIEDLAVIKDAWNRLFDQNSLLTAFQSWEFNYHWWKVNERSGKLHVLCIGNKNDLKFILPTYIDNSNVLKFLQAGSVDYLDALYASDKQIHGYMKKIKEYIFKTEAIESVVLNQLKKSSLLLDDLPYYFRKERYYILQTDSYSFIDNKDMDKERFLKKIKSRQFKNLRRIDAESTSTIEIIEKKSHVFPDAIIDTILNRMVKNGIREKSVYHYQLNFMKELYTNDKIFFIAQKNSTDYISISCFVRLAEHRIMSWLALYDPLIKNNNLKNYLHIIRFCQDNGYDFDLGTGIYPYKIQNFSPDMGSLYSFFFYKNPYKFVYYFLRKTVAKALKKI